MREGFDPLAGRQMGALARDPARMTLPGPSRRIVVQPVEEPAPAEPAVPVPVPAPAPEREPAPAPAPDREPEPAVP
jgi:hypothetical protein